MQHQLSTEDKRLTNLLEYAECCQCVYQNLKDIARVKAASKQYMEKRAALTGSSTATPAKKINTSTTTTQTTNSKPTR